MSFNAAVRGAALIAVMLFGSISIFITIVAGLPLFLISQKYGLAWMALGKRIFCILVVAITQFTSNTDIYIYAENQELASKFVLVNGKLLTKLDQRAVVISNHQLYTDWLYLWWMAYTGNLDGFITIILKDTIGRIPVFGWGTHLIEFILLSRKWEIDEKRLQDSMRKIIDRKDQPQWLLVFPEGTTYSRNWTKRSDDFAAKRGLTRPKNLLIPRTRGLQTCLAELNGAMPTLYDFTLFYDGIPLESFGEEHFSLVNMYLNGNAPKTVRIHVREFNVDDIPFKDHDLFTKWVYDRWAEKSVILEELRNETCKGKVIKTRVQLQSVLEVWGIFNVPLTMFLIYRLARKLVG